MSQDGHVLGGNKPDTFIKLGFKVEGNMLVLPENWTMKDRNFNDGHSHTALYDEKGRLRGGSVGWGRSTHPENGHIKLFNRFGVFALTNGAIITVYFGEAKIDGLKLYIAGTVDKRKYVGDRGRDKIYTRYQNLGKKAQQWGELNYPGYETNYTSHWDLELKKEVENQNKLKGIKQFSGLCKGAEIQEVIIIC
jgi:hypothetical protein